jgi:ribosomal-protein-alanine N-acetyltransferase
MIVTEFFQRLPLLKTPRLLLRELRKKDDREYFAFANDPRVTRYLRWGPHTSLDETQAYLDGVLAGYRSGTDGPWGIELAQERRLIGAIHLMGIDTNQLKADVGVVLHSHYWGQGLGSEALQAVLALCFTDFGLQRVQGLVITGNVSACRMMIKCGMKHEGVLRHYALQKGQWCDFSLYSILMEEFHSWN